jgi:hypothetical protein
LIAATVCLHNQDGCLSLYWAFHLSRWCTNKCTH